MPSDAPAPQTLSFLALGDSYTIGEGVDAHDRWPVQLARALREEGVALADPRIIATTGWTTDELAAAMDAAEPLGSFDFVSLQIGVNNQYRGREADEYRDAFETLLARAIALAGGRSDRVLVLGIPDWGATRFGASSGRDLAQVSRELDAYNAIARAVCRDHGVAFVDVAPSSRDRGAEDAMLAADGLHPSAAMYHAWVELALPVARRLLACPAASGETRPFDPETAGRIARAFRPSSLLGNRYDYYYSLAKLRSDPLYPGVLAALRGCQAPLLDLGCGLGLLAHALRQDGQAMAYRGVDLDAGKIRRAIRAASRAQLDAVGFDVIDLVQAPPAHCGSVAILDLLQYLPAGDQRRLLADAMAMLTPGSRLVIRTGLGDDSRRDRTTHLADRIGHWLGWMKTTPRSYPTRAGLGAQFEEAGLAARFTPLYGDTPFNNWLVVATR